MSNSCPNCNANLVGGSIWEYFFKEKGNEEEADIISAMYGATRDSGNWNRAIAIYSREQDRTTHWKCPDCDHIWDRL